ncbi:MAG: PAS domain-containing protein [Desulfobacterales bacterium]|nr:PAS domain-containing protein [Desulfobacterales bacterium]
MLMVEQGHASNPTASWSASSTTRRRCRPSCPAVMDRFAAIIERRNRRSREIEIELVGKERTLYQIIQGSTIPTFVINQDHIITHWNRALEKLTGLPAEPA